MADFDPTDLQAQDDQQAKAAADARLAQQFEVDDLKWVMSNKKGRRFALRLLERAGLWRLSFDTNALRMAFNEGTRNEGLRMVAQITEHCPARYNEMLEESRQP